jgi:hypothetical protein
MSINCCWSPNVMFPIHFFTPSLGSLSLLLSLSLSLSLSHSHTHTFPHAFVHSLELHSSELCLRETNTHTHTHTYKQQAEREREKPSPRLKKKSSKRELAEETVIDRLTRGMLGVLGVKGGVLTRWVYIVCAHSLSPSLFLTTPPLCRLIV